MSEAHIYQPTDIVLAKVKGYSAWPSMVIPFEIIPPNVLKLHSNEVASSSEPDTEESADGSIEYIYYSKVLSFKKDKEIKDFYCVKFFCDDSYIWVKYQDISPLTLKECEVWLNSSGRKNKKLVPAYEMAFKGLTRSGGVDVWEFVEYGSNGNPNDDDYVEDDEDESNGSKSRRSARNKRTRSSSRQRSKKQKTDDDEDDDEEDTISSRRTRRSATYTNKSEVEPPKSKNTRSRAKEVAPKQTVALKSKPDPKAKAVPKPKPKPVVLKYDYNDDEDWSIIGMGPQDLSIDKYVTPLVKRLSQKKNIEKHTDLRLDLIDKVSSINKLLFDIFSENLTNEKSMKQNALEIIVDELDIALSLKGSHDEFITIFRTNSELLFNFRLLFNLKQMELKKWDLWNHFQRIYKQIYEFEFIADTTAWSLNPISQDVTKEGVDSSIPIVEVAEVNN